MHNHFYFIFNLKLITEHFELRTFNLCLKEYLKTMQWLNVINQIYLSTVHKYLFFILLYTFTVTFMNTSSNVGYYSNHQD